MREKEFLGRGWKFPIQVDLRTGKIALSEHEEDIKEAIGIILRTSRGERVMRPEFGTLAADYAFSPMDDASAQSLGYELKNALARQEPRICDVDVRVDERGGTDGTVIIRVDYTVRSTNSRRNIVYPFFLMEGEG